MAARKSYMGFKKVAGVPRRKAGLVGQSIYEELLREVDTSGDTYALDTRDEKRAKSLRATLHQNIKRFGLVSVHVAQRDTAVYVYKED